ncbi:amidase family protein [Paenibacillus dokdonensis]|uniref:Amidase family protein n=2 Tax=Paenibacillus dokdonensis TaxID=2567944 RepID=A0ABU6GQF8_9BACL|nr:amidase family protein [Paenibacillus dokdonensis]MEC0240955.1 amidase family protein [Paenibacillus dokdonensis]
MEINMKIEEWIIEADIRRMQAAMEAGETSSEELVRVYLERIGRYDGKLRSIIEINPDAISIARALDDERYEKGSRGPLHGIPLLLKDNIDTHDALHTSAGTLALAEHVAAQDSFVAAQLRSAGAVFLGKANMTEWANFMADGMWAGYSTRRGLCLNPYGPGELFIGGSSSGSGAAVAANLAAVAIGTETSGSIISPASQNMLVGIKPTVGLVSRSGIIPITHTQDTAGPMARSVTDAAIVLGAMTGVDERDEVTKTSQGYFLTDYTPFLDASFLKQARIGIPRFYYSQLDPDRMQILEAALEVLRSEGATIIDPVELPCQETNWNWSVLRYEFKKGVNDYLAPLPENIPVHTLAEVIAFNNEHAEQCLKYGQNVLEASESTSGTLTEPEYVDTIRVNEEMSRAQGIDYALEKYNLDALLFLGCEEGDDIAARAGYPVITVPGGIARDGVIAPGGYITKGPQGITFIGTAYSEPTLIKIAYGYEQATKHRVPPEMGMLAGE